MSLKPDAKQVQSRYRIRRKT